MWPNGVQHWSEADVARDVQAAKNDFRARRLGEPLARYLQAFDAAMPEHGEWIAALSDLFGHDETSRHGMRERLGNDAARTALRYLAAPPISEDDLETLAETTMVAAAKDASGGHWDSLLSVIRATLDPRRFPWVVQERQPTDEEIRAAVLATSALSASQRVQTLRRGDEKSMVEGAVKGLLIGMGWRQAESRPARGIQNLLNDSPPPKTFLTQINLGADNADVVIRLDDGRLLAIECKGSNSEINSRKRLNKEAVQNARAWLGRFGAQVVPAVALQGVFKDRYVIEAQDTPMAIFWGHRLDDLRACIEATSQQSAR